ncbi:MAG: hypothetical protein M3Q71_07090 [Chloroflexota bacterium]|nr:hypothetical protein [Chloroflexota bacterium]
MSRRIVKDHLLDHERASGELTPDDLLTAATVCRNALLPAREDDWSVPAGDLTWDCRRTLDHVVDALLFYADQLAMRATRRLPALRNGDPDQEVEDLLMSLGTAAAVLAEVARAAGPGSRAFHRRAWPTAPALWQWGARRSWSIPPTSPRGWAGHFGPRAV